jgi:heme/copper-type cytochrome/quinol oxidase subunit 2
LAGPFKFENKALTIAAKGKPAQTTSPVVAEAHEPAKSRYVRVIITIGVIFLVAAGLAVYTKKSKA